jgi:formamidopyrimidine-DNA glycosylase
VGGIMPELPEVETVRRTLKNLILNKKIRDVDVFYSKMVRGVNEEEFKSRVIGRTFLDIKRVGKYLIFILDDVGLISHLRMEGKYFIKNADDPKDKHEHVIFYFEDGDTLRYNDTRKFGTFDLCELEDIDTLSPVSKLGYEPWDEGLTVKYLREKLKNKRIAIKTALLDQTIITGLGNIYVNEVLFLCQLNPEISAYKLKKKDLENVIYYSQKVLEKAIELGGTTIRSYTDSLGVTGRFQNELHVHDKEGEVCDVCGSLILKKKVNGRGTYYCPKCQK